MAKQKKIHSGCVREIAEFRDLAKESFVYGLKHKDNYTNASNRKIEKQTQFMSDWFQECVHSKTVEVDKTAKYISLNCREYSENPLYKMWKACSFTKNEVVFFFFVIDYLENVKEAATLAEIYNAFLEIVNLEGFSKTAAQKWMSGKGCQAGIIKKNSDGKYSLATNLDLCDKGDMIQYYSEVAPIGLIGSFIKDKQEYFDNPFSYKQHYIGQAFDCEILCNVLYAIKYAYNIEIHYYTEREVGKANDKYDVEEILLPVKVYSSTQNGRQYIIAWDYEKEKFVNCRLDRIKDITLLDIADLELVQRIQDQFKKVSAHIWGVSLGKGRMSHVEFVINVCDNEGYIVRRLYREKRCGTIVRMKDHPNRFKFEADVYDARELFPWIRTFICRITELKFSDKKLDGMFRDSLVEMYKNYSIEDETI